ncbi:SAM-dependent methyltransferase [Pseudonocardia sp. DLS-67]
MSEPCPIDTTVPHSARFWNYLLGGKDNYAVDRQAADQVLQHMPELGDGARADRGFLARAVRHLVAEAGIRQFLDVGTGLPTANNTHEVAQRLAPETRIVYVDNDPIVMAHAKALLTSSPEGVTDYIHADLRDPDGILRAAARTLDFTQPIALMLLGILNFVVDEEEARGVVDRLVAALPSGSYVAISHPTPEVDPDKIRAGVEMWNAGGGAQMTIRSKAELLRFFDGLELLEPGVVSDSLWRPDPIEVGEPVPVYHFGGVARKP